jgi:hypothetical protein
MEQATKDTEDTFYTLVAPKGKATITRWEKEIKEKRKGKAWDALTQEAVWVTDPGAMQPRETLYHKMMDMAWLTNMMIDKLSSEMEDSRVEDNKEHKKLLNEILSHLNSLETITKLLTEVEKDQKSKMEQLVAQFHFYLCYIDHMDIMPVDENGAPTHIRKTRTITQKEENKGQGMKERNTSLSWTSVWLFHCQVSLISLVSVSAYSFSCLLCLYFQKLDMVGLSWFPMVTFKSHPSFISKNATREPLVWFPFWQTRESPFLYHNPPLVIQALTLTYKKKTLQHL